MQKLRLLTLPSALWGPALPKYRQLVDYVKDFEVDPFTRIAAEKGKAFDNKAYTPASSSVSVVPVSIRAVWVTPQWNRAQELCESRGGSPGLPSLISLRFLWT